AIAAEATLAGLVALPDRDAVVRALDPPEGLALAAIEAATDRAEERFTDYVARDDGSAALLAEGQTVVKQACERYAAGGWLTDAQLAWLTVLQARTPVRDGAWQRIESAGHAARALHERLWTDVWRRCEPLLAAPAGALLAYTLWRGGDGLRA